MMPVAFHAGVLALLVVDAALSRWGKRHTLTSLLALLLAYGPMSLIPLLGPLGLTVLAAVVGVAGLFSFARLVGLWHETRFFVLTLVSTLSFYVAARVHWYGLFQAMPAFAMFFVAGAGTVRRAAHTFLQSMCLSWLGLIVYGYLFAHAAIFTDTDLGALPPAQVWLALILFCAKAGDVAWEAAQRLGAKMPDLQIPICSVGAALGGGGIHYAVPAALSMAQLALMGLIIGAALAAASRTYKLIVADVVGEDPERPMKGTMLFGFAFALALAYHYVRYLA